LAWQIDRNLESAVRAITASCRRNKQRKCGTGVETNPEGVVEQYGATIAKTLFVRA
jgi:hypothetical protein